MIAVDEEANIHIISMQMYLIYFVQMFLSRDKLDAGVNEFSMKRGVPEVTPGVRLVTLSSV